MEQEYLNKYKIQKIIPGELELKGYLYQLLGFIDKRSFLELAAIISDYMETEGMYDSNGDDYLAFWNVYKLNYEQVQTILVYFNIMPEYLYYFSNDTSANYQTEIQKIEEEENKINILPTFYSSYKKVIMNENSLLFIYRAGGCIVDVLSESGEKLSISEDLDLYVESDYFVSCKISCDKKTIRLKVLDRMNVWVEFLYENQSFIFNGSNDQRKHDNFYEPSEIETQYEKYLKDKKEIKKLPHSIKLFNQIWSTRNLDVTHFVNGDIIPEARTSEEWDEADLNKMPAWCYYNNSEINGEKFGKLYNWYAVNDPRGLAPEGWHIPSLEEWEKLAEELGEEGNIKIQGGNDWTEDKEMDDFLSSLFGAKEEEEELSKNNFEYPNKQNLFNQTGLTILPAGGRGRFGNAFYGKGDSAYFWTSTPVDISGEQSDEAYFVLIYINDTIMQTGNYNEKKIGFSVRCIRN